jgi:hypothetical protein
MAAKLPLRLPAYYTTLIPAGRSVQIGAGMSGNSAFE